MGNVDSSQLVEIPPGFEYMCLTLHKPDGIRVLHASERDLTMIKDIIMETWDDGLDNKEATTKCHGYVQSFKLSGFPFSKGSTSLDAVKARKLVSKLLWKLNNAGWRLVVATDLSRKLGLGTFYFVKDETESVSYQYPCINMSSSDKLQFINFSQRLYPELKSIIEASWSQGIQDVESEEQDLYEVKLFGEPWKGMGQASVEARSLVQRLIEVCAKNQLSFHCAANIKGTADSLFFYNEPRLTEGVTPSLFTISLNREDRLRLINAPPDMIPVVRNVLQVDWAWNGGIQKEGEYCGSFEFKLKGCPWWSSEKMSIMARHLISKILEALQGHGWHVIGGFDISRRMSNKSVLIFQQSAPMKMPIMCVNPSGSDKLRFINAPEAELKICREIIQTRWPKKISREKAKDAEPGVSCVQFKLNGSPWHGESDDKYYARSMMCFILQALKQRSWKLVLSADVSAKYDEDDDDEKYPLDVHSWWFMKIGAPEEPPAGAPPQYGFIMH